MKFTVKETNKPAETIKKPRKKTTSTAVKQRYNEKVYDVISVRIPKDLAALFKAKCQENGDSQAGIIKKAIEDYLNQANN